MKKRFAWCDAVDAGVCAAHREGKCRCGDQKASWEEIETGREALYWKSAAVPL
jgi:hypothetical protein